MGSAARGHGRRDTAASDVPWRARRRSASASRWAAGAAAAAGRHRRGADSSGVTRRRRCRVGAVRTLRGRRPSRFGAGAPDVSPPSVGVSPRAGPAGGDRVGDTGAAPVARGARRAAAAPAAGPAGWPRRQCRAGAPAGRPGHRDREGRGHCVDRRAQLSRVAKRRFRRHNHTVRASRARRLLRRSDGSGAASPRRPDRVAGRLADHLTRTPR